jgi:hypothetical protein
MGNTEDVTNSKNASAGSDILNDAEKVNNYVSWYLNGVMNRAEYGDTKNTAFNAANFSGPIQKLLPGVVLDAQRIKSISNAGDTNHNQIVVCGKSNIPIVGNFFKVGDITPVECYSGNGSGANDIVFRLKCPKSILGVCVSKDDNWEGSLSLFNTVTGGIAAVAIQAAKLLPPDLQKFIVPSLLGAWNQKIPPLPWGNDTSGKPFTEITYRKAYNEWRGQTCVLIPVINHLICFNNLLIPNKYANLYPYIPLSGTEDLEGKVAIDGVSSATNPATAGVTVQNVTFLGQKPAPLFFAHMQESDDLANLLQDTFVAKGLDRSGSPTDVASGTTCNTVEVRSNKGDNLFANQIAGQLHYNASFSCNFKPGTPDNSDCMKKCLDEGNPTSYCGSKCSSPGSFKIPTQSCSKDVYISLSTTSKTPEVDDIWSRLVAGPMSVFKRIFPKTNTEGGIGQIVDIPGSTNITYTGTGISQATTDIKFPHIGGISEYFLNGIQTILRPKGYGESILFAPATEGTAADCDKNAPDVSLKNTLNKQDYYQLALRWVGSDIGTKALECYNDTVKRAQEAGINPAFALLIWLHESDASNYNISTMDFGANYPAPAGFVGQINEFFNRAKNYTVNDTRCNWSSLPSNQKDNMHVFAWIYRNGRCDPNYVNPEGETGEQYYQNLSEQWKYITSCPFPNSPTDTTCP